MDLVRVRNHDGKDLIVQRVAIPTGYNYVEDYKQEVSANKVEQPLNKLKRLKKDDLKNLLNEKEVEYKNESTKDELINLLKENE